MTLLPNVETLLLPFGLEYDVLNPSQVHTSAEDLEVWKVMKAVRRNVEDNPNGAALRNLTRLYILQRKWGGLQFSMDTLYPFLAIPNLTYLFASSCKATKEVYSYEVPISNMSSSLRTVELYDCCMDSEGVSQVLSKLPHLVSFRYSHASNKEKPDFDAGAFVAAIGKQAGDRLKALAVNIDSLAGSITTGIVSMDEFTKLETIELDYRLFHGPSIESGEMMGVDPKDPKPGYDEWTTQAIPSIYKILPKALESFDLYIQSLSDQDPRCNPHMYSEGLKQLFQTHEQISEGMLLRLRLCRVRFLSLIKDSYLYNGIKYSDVFRHLQSLGVECEVSFNQGGPFWISELQQRLWSTG